MTELGHRVLAALVDGPSTLAELAKACTTCGRRTRSTVMGCQVAGLVEPVPDSYPLRVQLTEQGRALARG